jgi:hypothetical protein
MGEAVGKTGGGGSSMGDMATIGAGLAMGQQMAESLQPKKDTPPKLPTKDETTYHIALDDVSEGPYNIRTIREMIERGAIKRDTLVWRKGLDDWQPADTQFGKYFQNTPPPLP